MPLLKQAVKANALAFPKYPFLGIEG